MNIISVSRRCPGLGPCRPGPSSATEFYVTIYGHSKSIVLSILSLDKHEVTVTKR